MKRIFSRTREKITIYLSHRPKLYAFVVGFGIVLFWRGAWHSTDFVHTYFNIFQNNLSTDSISSPWWDGPLSLVVGCIILYFAGAFVSSFIGNELILSGLKKEKKIEEKTEIEVKTEADSVLDIKTSLRAVEDKLEELEKTIQNNETSKKK